MQNIIRGMVQVGGTTYRITRLQPKLYEVVRLIDDTPVGKFQCGRHLEVMPSAIDAAAMYQIARAAIREAKTSWMGTLEMVE